MMSTKMWGKFVEEWAVVKGRDRGWASLVVQW